MRWDMKHVIIDRPRKGGDGGKSKPPKGTKRRWQRLAAEDYPTSESTARRYGANCKYLNEHLAPLIRWLRGNCGRPWNKVYSEICAGLSVRNATSAHVRDHAEKFVLQNTLLINGSVCDSRGNPLNVGRWVWCPFYVDPRNGILREAARQKRPRHHTKEMDFVEGKDQFHQYRLVNDIWYEVELTAFPTRSLTLVRDVLLHKALNGHEAGHAYCAYIYAKSKRQLGKEEIKKLKLRETPLGRLNSLAQSREDARK